MWGGGGGGRGDGGDCKGRQMCIICGFAMEDVLEGDCVDKSINIL